MAEFSHASQQVQAALFDAIASGRFENIPSIAQAYKLELIRRRAENGGKLDISLETALQPLSEAIQYLRIVRAHQSLQFRKVAASNPYGTRSVVDKGRTLALHG